MSVENLEYTRTMIAGREKPLFQLPIPLYLGWKDIWRNRGRYFLISLVVALITTLVLFIAGLAEGLGAGNREFIEKLNGDIVLYQANVDLSIPSSRLGWSKLREVGRVEGVKDAGFLGFANASLVFEDQEPLDISLIGAQPGKPGEPPVLAGRGLQSRQANEAIIDSNVAERRGVRVGDVITVKSILGADEKYYDLQVAGITDSRQNFIQPSIILPYQTWDEVKPQSTAEKDSSTEPVYNIMAVQFDNRADFVDMQSQIQTQVSDVEAVDRVTAYEATPGYTAQQSTLNTQRTFTLIIGILVLGGFFQIQTLQKVAQVGMLKAIGASSRAIIITSTIQIVAINVFGVFVGALGTYLLTLALPSAIPLVFRGDAITSALLSLLLIGPIGGVVSIFTLLRAEPLTALGLSN